VFNWVVVAGSETNRRFEEVLPLAQMLAAVESDSEDEGVIAQRTRVSRSKSTVELEEVKVHTVFELRFFIFKNTMAGSESKGGEQCALSVSDQWMRWPHLLQGGRTAGPHPHETQNAQTHSRRKILFNLIFAFIHLLCHLYLFHIFIYSSLKYLTFIHSSLVNIHFFIYTDFY
jgi:hypothetical protein